MAVPPHPRAPWPPPPSTQRWTLGRQQRRAQNGDGPSSGLWSGLKDSPHVNAPPADVPRLEWHGSSAKRRPLWDNLPRKSPPAERQVLGPGPEEAVDLRRSPKESRPPSPVQGDAAKRGPSAPLQASKTLPSGFTAPYTRSRLKDFSAQFLQPLNFGAGELSMGVLAGVHEDSSRRPTGIADGPPHCLTPTGRSIERVWRMKEKQSPQLLQPGRGGKRQVQDPGMSLKNGGAFLAMGLTANAALCTSIWEIEAIHGWSLRQSRGAIVCCYVS